MTIKKYTFICLILFAGILSAQKSARTIIRIPDILGYKTLKCDMHMHTVFSDGEVWPTTRVDEAWRDGLDAIAITDHIEYRPHKETVKGDMNSSFDIAAEAGRKKGILVIHGSEISRAMPPGHMNALFITDGNAFVKDNWKDAALEVKNQGGIIQWNHPGWKAQQPDGMPRWYAEHDWLISEGLLKSIEVCNGRSYYPLVQKWCAEKNLAMVGNSDNHSPIQTDWNDTRRVMTLVFATEKSLDGIKQAVIDGRTVVLDENVVYGAEKYMKALLDASIVFDSKSMTAKGKEKPATLLTNNSDIPYTFELVKAPEGLDFPKSFTVPGSSAVLFGYGAVKDTVTMNDDVTVQYAVKNLKIQDDQPLQVSFTFHVDITAKK